MVSLKRLAPSLLVIIFFLSLILEAESGMKVKRFKTKGKVKENKGKGKKTLDPIGRTSLKGKKGFKGQASKKENKTEEVTVVPDVAAPGPTYDSWPQTTSTTSRSRTTFSPIIPIARQEKDNKNGPKDNKRPKKKYTWTQVKDHPITPPPPHGEPQVDKKDKIKPQKTPLLERIIDGWADIITGIFLTLRSWFECFKFNLTPEFGIDMQCVRSLI